MLINFRYGWNQGFNRLNGWIPLQVQIIICCCQPNTVHNHPVGGIFLPLVLCGGIGEVQYSSCILQESGVAPKRGNALTHNKFSSHKRTYFLDDALIRGGEALRAFAGTLSRSPFGAGRWGMGGKWILICGDSWLLLIGTLSGIVQSEASHICCQIPNL